MKKLLAAIIVCGMTASLSAAFASAPASASHDVEVRIPAVMMIRFAHGKTFLTVPASPVVFNLPAATFEPIARYPPTDPHLANWNEIFVLVNSTRNWRVTVATTAVGPAFDWSKIRVTPASRGDWSFVPSAFNLPAAGTPAVTILSHHNRDTAGWRRLGIGPAEYALHLDGTELAGTYTATVTYSIVSP